MQTVTFHGPIFSGALDGAVKQGIELAQTEVAQVGAEMVRARLHAVIKRPTPYYWTRIFVQPTPDPIVWDSGIVYGPWLEGTGTRNATTRFKGYRTFRVTRQKLQEQAAEIAAPIIARKVRSA